MKNLVLIIALVFSFLTFGQTPDFSSYEEVDYNSSYTEQGFGNNVYFTQPDGSIVYEMTHYPDMDGVQQVLLQADILISSIGYNPGDHGLDYADFLIEDWDTKEVFQNVYDLPDGGKLLIGLRDTGAEYSFPYVSVLYADGKER